MIALKNDNYITYENYLEMDLADGQYELIDGILYAMAGTSHSHQTALGNLSLIIGNQLKGRRCQVYTSTMEFKFAYDKNSDNFVMPDLMVVCNPDNISKDKRSVIKAPDLIVEVVSPSNRKNDIVYKFNRYLEAGVKEYWVIEPDAKYITVHNLQNGHYITKLYEEGDTIKLTSLENLAVDVNEVFYDAFQ